MAAGSVRRRGSGWSYTIDLPRDPLTGKRRQRLKGGFHTKADAQKAMRDALATSGVRTAKQLGTYMTEDWLPVKATTVTPDTLNQYRWQFDKYVRPTLGSTALSRLDRGAIQQLESELLASGGRDGRPLSARTVRYTHQILKMALADAVLWGYLDATPMAGVKPPRSTKEDDRSGAWTAEQLSCFLLATKDDRLHPLWRLLAWTGMRRGEALALTWADLNHDASTLTIDKQVARRDKGWEIRRPKTRKSNRTIDIDEVTLTTLRRWRKSQAADQLLYGTDYSVTDHIFTGISGGHLSPSVVSAAFRAAVGASGVPRIRLHDLRHTQASILLESGVDPKTVSERLGHGSIAITLQTYSHTTRAMHQDAVVRLAESMGEG